jgi:hypothetical protein
MQICYLWVERFRNLRDFSFNFDSDRKFSYDSNTHRITRTQVAPLPKNFFPLPVTEVTALVGQNGVGKSNALELICKILKSGRSSFKFDFLLIYTDDRGIHCSYKFRDRGRPQASIRLNYREHTNLDALKVIFYSNVFTDRERDFGAGVIDLSPDRVEHPRYESKNNRINRTNQLQKQIWFINSNSGFNDLNLQPPTHVSITISRGPLDPGAGRMLSPNYLLAKAGGRLRDRARSLGTVKRFVFLFSFAYLNKILVALRPSVFSSAERSNPLFQDVERLIQNLLDIPTKNLSDAILDYLRSVALHVPLRADLAQQAPTNYRGVDRESIEAQVKFILDSETRLSGSDLTESESEFRNTGIYGFDLAYNLPNSSWLTELLDVFAEVQCFNVDWIGISSGQRAYLNLFSLIAYALHSSGDTPVFLCIDEGDLYLHPKWQLEFFSRLLNMLEKTQSRSIQLLLTSHSPFLLADLPRQNIVVLTNPTSKSMSGVFLENETFGGNLYDLYAGPLFIDTLKTSLFAQAKIAQLAAEARERPLSETKRKRIEKQLRLVGDDIIKHIIQSDLND